jgi:hypothetical protein
MGMNPAEYEEIWKAAQRVATLVNAAQNDFASPARRQCGVRKVLIAIVVLIVVVWLIPNDPLPDGERQAPPPVAPVVATPESASTSATDDAPAISDPPAASNPVEPPVLRADEAALSPMAQRAKSALSLRDPGPDGVAQAFAAEPVDPFWATGMEGRILERLAQAKGLQVVTMQVECRTSMCRVQLVEFAPKQRDPGAFADLVRGFGLDVWRVNGLVDQSGTPTSVAYLGRHESLSPAQQQAVVNERRRKLPPAQRDAVIGLLLLLQRDDLEANDTEPQAAPRPPTATPPPP